MLPPRRLLTLLAAMATTGLTALLAYRSLNASALPGCGVGSACDALLHSAYARVPPTSVPVSALALLMDLTVVVMLLLPRPSRVFLNTCAGMLVAAAIYFTAIQLFILHHICPWCMAAHVMGLTTGLLLLLPISGEVPRLKRYVFLGIAAVGALALIQQFVPSPTAQATVIRFADTGPGPQRTLTLVVGDQGGRLEPHALPVLGSPDAPILLISFFDYTCGFCQAMDHQIQSVRQAFGPSLAVVAVGVPLGTCNPNVPRTLPGHALSCDLQRLSLAVWKINPAAFEAIHQAFFDPNLTLAEARALALQYVEASQLDRTLDQPWINAQLVRHSTLFDRLGGALPQLIVGPTHVRGLPPAAQTLIDLVAQQTGLNPIKISP